MAHDIATCSYRDYAPDMGTAVRITLGKPPAGMSVRHSLDDLSPKGWYFRSKDFDLHYLAQLERVGVDSIRAQLAAIPPPAVLLCFEYGPRITAYQCHRRMFADWWMDRTGEEVPELGGREFPRCPQCGSKVPVENVRCARCIRLGIQGDLFSLGHEGE